MSNGNGNGGKWSYWFQTLLKVGVPLLIVFGLAWFNLRDEVLEMRGWRRGHDAVALKEDAIREKLCEDLSTIKLDVATIKVRLTQMEEHLSDRGLSYNKETLNEVARDNRSMLLPAAVGRVWYDSGAKAMGVRQSATVSDLHHGDGRWADYQSTRATVDTPE